MTGVRRHRSFLPIVVKGWSSLKERIPWKQLQTKIDSVTLLTHEDRRSLSSSPYDGLSDVTCPVGCGVSVQVSRLRLFGTRSLGIAVTVTGRVSWDPSGATRTREDLPALGVRGLGARGRRLGPHVRWGVWDRIYGSEWRGCLVPTGNPVRHFSCPVCNRLLQSGLLGVTFPFRLRDERPGLVLYSY